MLSLTCKPAAFKLQAYLFLSFFIAGFLLSSNVSAQVTPPAGQNPPEEVQEADETNPKAAEKDPWYETISLRGYVQVRYNRLLETNPDFSTEYDRSVGGEGGFLIRRARLVFSGNVHDRVLVYIQSDFASTPTGSSSIHFLQMRDAYADISLDAKKEYRFRLGQSKIPYGFENMQSSQNRLTLDRADALNSAVPNERDLGLMFYWAPEHIRDRFSKLGSRSLKGSGDYGVFALGVFNGQGTNRSERNDNLHAVSRLSYPIAFKNGQVVEPGIQAYTGLYNVASDQLSTKVKGGNFEERRVGATLMVYPQPFGFLAEYNIGKGPEFDPVTQTIQVKSLTGGYAQVMYNLKVGKQLFIPFAKVQYYEGGKKNETDARFSRVYETEIGVEWQPIPAFELVTQYTISDRTNEDGKELYNRQAGNLLRIQGQFNF